jgi:cytochrome P450
VSTDTSPLYWDPFDPELRNDPYPLWRRLRDEAPLWHNERHDFWVLSRFDDIEAAHKDTATYSSSHGTTIEVMTPEPMSSGMIINVDPPRHTVLRALVSRAFTTRRIAAIEEDIRAIFVRFLDAQEGKDRFDYVQDVAVHLPPNVISTLLGIPEGDREELRQTIDRMFHIEDGKGMMNRTSRDAGMAVRTYLDGQLSERRTSPRDDMLTAIVQAEIDEAGERRSLTQSEAIDFAMILFVAGSETVARLLGWSVSVLDQHPDQRAELAADLSLVPNAIEEMLRFEAPSPVNARWTTRDVALHGQTMPADSKVVLLTGSAVRDERRFPDPDRFDIHRKIDHHVTFGYGIHFCLGAALARMEGRIALEETLKRHPTWQVDRAGAVFSYTSTVRGYANLPILV